MSNINDERKINERYKMMTEQPVKRLILKMAVPTIISMLVTTITIWWTRFMWVI